MTEYHLTPQQKDWFFQTSGYSLVDDAVHRPGVQRYEVRGPGGPVGVLYRFGGSNNFVLMTEDPELMRSMRGMGIAPQKGGLESSIAGMGSLPGYRLTADQYRTLVERLGGEYGQARDGSITYLVAGKDGNERRIRGNEAVRNGGLGAAAAVRPQLSEFKPSVTMGYVITTSDPRILAELRNMGIGELGRERAKKM